MIPSAREPGPRPALRAMLGLLLGMAAGALAAALLPREPTGRPPAASGQGAVPGARV